jgi:hypothetical protein
LAINLQLNGVRGQFSKVHIYKKEEGTSIYVLRFPLHYAFKKAVLNATVDFYASFNESESLALDYNQRRDQSVQANL